jgi:uncharacterized membrane protein (DUF373 family)
MSSDLLRKISVDNGIKTNQTVLQIIEYFASIVLIILFAIGLFDLVLEIYQLAVNGAITEPSAVIGLIDTVLLLFIIVELHETVIAYAEEEGLERVVTIVLYTAIIAVARKFIIFRTGDYATTEGAILASLSYVFIGISLAVLLVAFKRYIISDDID